MVASSTQQSVILKNLDDLSNDRLNALKSEIIRSLQSYFDSDPFKTTKKERDRGQVHWKLATLAEDAMLVTNSKEKNILRSLRFRTMKERHSSISPAHIGTFRWVFDNAAQPDCQHVNLGNWLEQGVGCYWVTGKAGSGKSTLMKYILEEQRTEQLLRRWAGQNKLVIASFFFWNAGTMMQKSQVGLLQSLLHDILIQCPSMIPRICSSRWKNAEFQGEPDEPSWTLSELTSAFDALAQERILNFKMCVFIDGLDEYDGDPMTMVLMVQRLVT